MRLRGVAVRLRERHAPKAVGPPLPYGGLLRKSIRRGGLAPARRGKLIFVLLLVSG